MKSRATWGLAALVSVAAFVLSAPFAFGSGATTSVRSAATQPGNAAAGKPVFVKFCGKCHTMKAAGSRGTLGQNLDTVVVDYARVITAVREGIGGIQAEYTFANKCSPTDSRCLTWDQLRNVAKFVVVKAEHHGGHYNAGSP